MSRGELTSLRICLTASDFVTWNIDTTCLVHGRGRMSRWVLDAQQPDFGQKTAGFFWQLSAHPPPRPPPSLPRSKQDWAWRTEWRRAPRASSFLSSQTLEKLKDEETVVNVVIKEINELQTALDSEGGGSLHLHPRNIYTCSFLVFICY